MKVEQLHCGCAWVDGYKVVTCSGAAYRRRRSVKIERGMQVGKRRMEFTLQSSDVDSHSIMSDNHQFFESIGNRIRQFGEDLIREEIKALPAKKGQTT